MKHFLGFYLEKKEFIFSSNNKLRFLKPSFLAK